MADIDIDLVKRLVATQFPQWSGLPIRPVAVSGWDNRTFRLGDHMSVRLPSAESYSSQVETEHRWLPKLAALLPLPIPAPLETGVPGQGYPWHWSIYRWIDGETADTQRIQDLPQFAIALAAFLATLQRIGSKDGPLPGQRNFFRGGDLSVYDEETRSCLVTLDRQIDARRATEVWEMALGSIWRASPVWVHGDVSVGNLLVKEGMLAAVIDFGNLSIGDPACDLTIAWTLLYGESRSAFRCALPLDEATWRRARGWALWKALITLAKHLGNDPGEADKAKHIIAEILADHIEAAVLRN